MKRLLHSISKLLCCCGGPNDVKQKVRTRKDLRAELELLQQQLAKSKEGYEGIKEEESPLDLNYQPFTSKDYFRDQAARYIQPIIRGFLGRRRAFRAWLEALEEADRYWLYQQWLRDEEERIRRLREELRQQYILSYVGDLVDTSVQLVVQAHEACLTIQRTWRGHRCRLRLPRKPLPKPKRLVRIVQKGRFDPNTLRRVWARDVYEPDSKPYIHNTDFGYDKYDIWEHAAAPPEGRKHGLITRKVLMHTEEEREQFVLSHDKHAWVGVPVGTMDKEERKKKIPEDIALRNSISPLRGRDRKSITQSNKQAQTESTPKKLPAAESLPPSAIGRYLHRLGYDVSQEIQLDSLPFLSQRNRNKTLSVHTLKYLGREVVRPPLFALKYDPLTGQLLIYKRGEDGVGWRRVRDNQRVSLGGALEKEPPLPLQTLPPSLAPLLPPPSVYEQRSGYIEVQNKFMAEGGGYVKGEREKFIDKFISPSAPAGSWVTGGFADGVGGGWLEAGSSFVTDPALQSQAGSDVGYPVLDASAPSMLAPPVIQFSRTGSPIRGGRKVLTLKTALEEQERGRSAPPPNSSQILKNKNAHESTLGMKLRGPLMGPMGESAEGSMTSSYFDPELLFTLLEKEGKEMKDQEVWERFRTLALERDKLTRRSTIRPTISLGGDDTGAEEWEEGEVWSRALFRPPKEIVSRLNIRPRRKENYKLKYEWIPQPLVHNAVNNVYINKHFYNNTMYNSKMYSQYFQSQSNSRDYRQEIYQKSDRLLEKKEREQILQIVTEDLEPEEREPKEDLYGSTYLSEQISPMAHYYYEDDGQWGSVFKEDDASSSAQPDSGKHPLRQRMESFVGKRPRVIRAEQDDGGDSVSSLEQSSVTSLSNTLFSGSMSRKSLSLNNLSSSLFSSSKADSSKAQSTRDPRKNAAKDFKSFLGSVPEGHLPDMPTMKKTVRATKSNFERLAATSIHMPGTEHQPLDNPSGTANLGPAASVVSPVNEMLHIRKKSMNSSKSEKVLSRKFRHPPAPSVNIFGQGKKDKSVHPYDWTL